LKKLGIQANATDSKADKKMHLLKTFRENPLDNANEALSQLLVGQAKLAYAATSTKF
jgi:hypothetical protein